MLSKRPEAGARALGSEEALCWGFSRGKGAGQR